MTRELTCIVCPKGCQLTVELEGKAILSVSGHTCKRGEAYAVSECSAPMRTLNNYCPRNEWRSCSGKDRGGYSKGAFV